MIREKEEALHRRGDIVRWRRKGEITEGRVVAAGTYMLLVRDNGHREVWIRTSWAIDRALWIGRTADVVVADIMNVLSMFSALSPSDECRCHAMCARSAMEAGGLFGLFCQIDCVLGAASMWRGRDVKAAKARPYIPEVNAPNKRRELRPRR